MAMGGLLRLFERAPGRRIRRRARRRDLSHRIRRSTPLAPVDLRVGASRDVLSQCRRGRPCARRANSPNATRPGSARVWRGCRAVAFAPARKRRFGGSNTRSSIGRRDAASSGSSPARAGRIICVAGERPHVARRVNDFLKREACEDIEAAVSRHAKASGLSRSASLARHGEPLGFVLVGRRPEFFLAADPRATLRARLSRRPRGRALGPHEPFAKSSGRWSAACPRT